MPITSIKPGITAEGFRVAVRDYTEPTVIEELAANSYDADASTVLVLLDADGQELHVIDDGLGFSREAIENVAILGAGQKQSLEFSKGKRHYLGSYGFGLKSSLNIAKRVGIHSVSIDGDFLVEIDWMKLDDALRPNFEGFSFRERKKLRTRSTGTHITLYLGGPASKEQLDQFGSVLSNLPEDRGKFRCYYGLLREVAKHNPEILRDRFNRLRSTARELIKTKALSIAGTSSQADLEECQIVELADREDKKVKAKYFFAGVENGKVRSLKPGLRGIYIRIHGRLLKQSFTERKYTYNISKWVKFENGLRLELSVDWLRNEISLSREGVRFSNPKLEEAFRSLLTRMTSRFIQPELKKLLQKSARETARRQQQRMELAKKRIGNHKSIRVPGVSDGFHYRPETDGELALVLAQRQVLRRVNSTYQLVDYNDQAPFDSLIYDRTRREFLKVELEPTLVEFLQHRDQKDIDLIVTWSLGKWRTGAKKHGRGSYLKLIAEEDGGAGRYRLLSYPTARSKTPRAHLPVVVLEELLSS